MYEGYTLHLDWDSNTLVFIPTIVWTEDVIETEDEKGKLDKYKIHAIAIEFMMFSLSLTFYWS